ncbi:MAG TPA: metal-dependent hydrolase [Patescibacteria group bacterium]|nr:metal-dependent hydrolase [Patescibacteria group bacterium]
MPNYKTHLVLGLVFVVIAIVIAYYFGFGNFFEFGDSWKLYIFAVGVTLLYSILPDLDIKTSKAFLLISFCLLAFIIFCFLKNEIIFGIISASVLILMLFLQHRGRIHSFLAALLFSIPIIFVSWTLAIVGFLAYASHLIADGEIK